LHPAVGFGAGGKGSGKIKTHQRLQLAAALGVFGKG